MSEQKQPAEVGPVELVLGPLPEPIRRHDGQPLYGAGQLRDYAAQQVAAQRQRISALMEAHVGIRLATVEYLEAMRQGPTPQEWAALDAEPRA